MDNIKKIKLKLLICSLSFFIVYFGVAFSMLIMKPEEKINYQSNFKVSEKKETLKETKIENLKITVRKLTKDDIKTRNLPNQTSGLVITKIENDSPLVNSIEVNSIILEAQKKKIRTSNDLIQIVKQVLSSSQKTILLVIYNSQNQRRYIGVKLD